MIWTSGEVVERLSIDVNDRTFEHGLGLFETLRTWDGYPSLLGRHLDRLMRSAVDLGLEVDPSGLPGPRDVEALLAAEGREGDAMLRITASGGGVQDRRSIVWMRAADLPSPSKSTQALLQWVYDGGGLDAYKTLNYWERRNSHSRAHDAGWDEAIFVSGDEIREGSRSNIFFVVDDRLITPPLQARRPIVPGVMRGLVLKRAQKSGLRAEEAVVSWKSLPDYTEAFLTNSARGIVPLRKIANHGFPAPGNRTARLWDEVRRWLELGGDAR